MEGTFEVFSGICYRLKLNSGNNCLTKVDSQFPLSPSLKS